MKSEVKTDDKQTVEFEYFNSGELVINGEQYGLSRLRKLREPVGEKRFSTALHKKLPTGCYGPRITQIFVRYEWEVEEAMKRAVLHLVDTNQSQ